MTSEEEWSVHGWLKSFGFEKQYLFRFIDNGYETKKLCSKLKPEDLDEMKITNVPHRNILFNQSDMLRTGLDRPSSTQSTSSNPYERLDKLSSPASPNSVCSVDHNSDTYSAVFDDISEAKKSKTIPAPKPLANIKKKSSTVERSSSITPKNNVPRTVSTGAVKHHSLSTGSNSPKTKLELKLLLRELVQRDAIIFSEPPYSNEGGTANTSALAELAESYADELNIESLTIMDALEDVWRYKMNENSDFVIPKTAKHQNSSNLNSASSVGSFVFNDQATYSEPFDSKPVNKPLLPPNKPSVSHPSVSSVGTPKPSSSEVEGATYLDPFDAIDGNNPVIIKTSPSTEKKKPYVSPKPTGFKNAIDISKDPKRILPAPESPSLSIHSSSSEDTDKSPKVKKSWAPFRRSGKTPEIQKRKLNKTKRLSGSMEDLDERVSSYHASRGSRQSLPPTDGYTGLSRSISTNPALLYQQSLIADLKNSKKKFGGSQGAIHQYSPKITSPIINEFHKAAGALPSPKTKSRVKAVTVGGGQNSSELELSTWIEVYIEGQSDPVRYQKAQTLNQIDLKKEKKQGGFMSRIFKKKDKKKSMDKIDESSSDENEDNEREELSASHSLPDIAAMAQAKVHSEYTEVYDLLERLPRVENAPPKLPSRNVIQNFSPTSSPQASPPTHHKLMVKSDSISSNEIIHSLPSSGDDVIEIRVPTPSNATYSEPWTHIPIAKSPKTRQSPNTRNNNGRGSSGSSSQSDSPRKGSSTIASPVRRRKLFDDGGSSPTSCTLPRYLANSVETCHDQIPKANRLSARSLTPDDTNDSPTHTHSFKPETKFKSTENLFLQETTPLKGLFRQANDQISVTPQKPVGQTHKLIHTNSSPGCSYTKNERKMLAQLKQTGISFQGRDLGYTPPVSPDQYDDTIQHTHASTGSEQIQTISDFSNLLPGDVVEVSFKKNRVQTKKKSLKSHNQSLVEAKVELLIQNEGIDLTELPYSNLKGEYGIPTALVSRYAQESRSSEEELVKAIDSIRRTELIKNRRSHIPFKKDWRKFNDINASSLEEFLLTIGLPQYNELLTEQRINNLLDLKGTTNEQLNSLPLKESHKKHLCAFVKRL